MTCPRCRNQMTGFVCECGWRRLSHTYVVEKYYETMAGVTLHSERKPGMWTMVYVPEGSMAVVDDVVG